MTTPSSKSSYKWIGAIIAFILLALAGYLLYPRPNPITMQPFPNAGISADAEAAVPQADGCDHTVSLDVEKVDGEAEFANVEPGDTVCIEAGTRSVLKISNFQGAKDHPITFINSGGVVLIEATDKEYAGIHFQNSEYVRLTGTGVGHVCGAPYTIEEQACGFVVRGSQRGVVGSEQTHYIEMDHVEAHSSTETGFFVRTSATDEASRESWTQYDTYVHHNYVHDAGTEGFYIGGSKYRDGLDPVLIGVEASYNLVMDTGRDGLQVGSAVEDCTIHHNRILRDSLENNESQRSGIMNNRGSVCHIYNNFIADSTSRSIYVQGNGGNQIYNNVIVRPGQYIAENNGDGIMVTSGSNTGQSVYIWHNTIVEPSRSGIRFRNGQGDDNQIQNNFIVKSGNFFSLDTEYIDTNDLPNVLVSNNLALRILSEAHFANLDRDYFALLPDSPAVDGGVALGITADYDSKTRPQGSAVDVGAFELTP